MIPVLYEVERLTPLHGVLLAAVLVAAAVLWTLWEARSGRLDRGELGKAMLWSVGTAALAGAILYGLSRFIHPIQVRSYGVMLMLAFAAGIVVAMQRARLYRVEPSSIIDLSLLILVASLIGARVCYVALNWSQEFSGETAGEVVSVWEGGLSFHGGVAGGVLAGLVFSWWRRVRLSLLADLVAPSVAVGYAIARIGCFLNGCCHGGPSRLPWGVDFPEPPGQVQVHVCVHPTQLYSSLGSVAIAIVLLWLVPRIRVPGHLGLIYVALYSALRYTVEFWRRGYTARPWGPLPGLTEAQAASLALIVVSLVVMLLTRRRVGYPLPESEELERPEPEADGAAQGADKARKRRRRSRSTKDS